MIIPKVHLSSKIFDKDVELLPTRNGYGDGLLILGETNKDVVVLTGDLEESTRVIDFHKKYPNRFVEVGVAEQNMMGIAAGLAQYGKIPYISSYAVFSPGRSWDQARVSVAYTNANVKVAGAHTGISVGPDGATHQALEDIAITRVLPNFVVLAPCDSVETKKVTLWSAQHEGPVYFRFGREKTPIMTTEKTPWQFGKAYVMWEHGKPDVAIIGVGPLLHEALLAAKELEKSKIHSVVINSHTIKPIDVDTIAKYARKAGSVVTVEEHQINNGLGSAVAEVLVEHAPVPMERIGMRDTFGESGSPSELLTKYHMKATDIVSAVKKVIKRKQTTTK